MSITRAGVEELTTYKEAEEQLKRYFSGKLALELQERKFKLTNPPRRKEKDLGTKVQTTKRTDQLEQEVLKYVDDGTYTYLKKIIIKIEKHLEFVRRTDKTSYRILWLYYYHKQPWKEVANAVYLSESQCRRKRRQAIEELRNWI